MKFRPLTTAVALTLALPTAAFASDAPSGQATDLDEVLVTATRTEIAIEDSVVPVQVIDRAQIERSQASSLQELLKGRAGISLGNQGGLGKLSSIFMRGTNSSHVLVLVDGMRIGAATNGMPMIQDLPLEQIERIEIVRGPRSSLYGSEAIGGVIQIFTRTAVSGLQQQASLGAGNNNLFQASAGLSNRGERGWVSANAGYQETDGIDACRGTAEGWGAGCFVDEPDLDGYRNVSINLRGGLTPVEGLNLEGHLLQANGFNEFDGSIWSGNEAYNRQQVFGGRLDWKAGERVAIKAQVGRTSDEADSYFVEDGVRTFVSTVDTRRDLASVQGDFGVGAGQLLSAGIDWQQDRVAGTTAFDVDSRDNLAGFVQYHGRFGAHTLEASVRNDDNEQFGNHSTGSLGYGLDFGGGWRLTASAGTAFKAPTFNDLYWPGFSNPDLLPEESRSVNLGIAQHGAGWNWSLNAFDTRVEQLIGFDSGFNVVNIDEARIRGAELTAFASLAGFDVNAELSHVDPRNRSGGANDGNLLPRRPRDTGRVDVDRAFGAFKIGLTGFGASHRFDDAGNFTRLAGYGTLDVRVEYAIAPGWTLQARAANVFDREYETVDWYNQPGREYGVTVRWQSR